MPSYTPCMTFSVAAVSVCRTKTGARVQRCRCSRRLRVPVGQRKFVVGCGYSWAYVCPRVPWRSYITRIHIHTTCGLLTLGRCHHRGADACGTTLLIIMLMSEATNEPMDKFPGAQFPGGELKPPTKSKGKAGKPAQTPERGEE